MEKEGYKPTPIDQLPSDYWSTTDHLVADVYDAVQALTWMQADPKSRSSAPPWHPRPGSATRKPKGAAAWLAGLGIGEAAKT